MKYFFNLDFDYILIEFNKMLYSNLSLEKKCYKKMWRIKNIHRTDNYWAH